MGCKKAVVVCALIGFLGVLSAMLGFAAEGTRVKAISTSSTLHQLYKITKIPMCTLFKLCCISTHANG